MSKAKRAFSDLHHTVPEMKVITIVVFGKLKRALLQGLLDFGGPSLLRRFLALAASFRQQGDENESYVAGFQPAATEIDIADAALIRPYR